MSWQNGETVLRHLPPLAAVGFALFVFTGFLTYGTGRLADADWLSGVYDAQGESLAHGRFDVPRRVMYWEAFVRDGRTYTYFGPTPALPRILLNRAFAGMSGRWSRISLLVSCALNLAFEWLFVRFIQEKFLPVEVRENLPGVAVAAFLILAGSARPTSFSPRASGSITRQSPGARRSR